MDRLADLLSVLPAPMRDPVLFAIPFFLLLLTINSLQKWRRKRFAGE